ncbi:hypothetical protein T552_00256 [Pneumocystis carinii B80]|uniref:Uncharacterized protein n=1 Tax=Pneumocystis carinii (strain B80) TaxID=1408658 RepID=A0A0W4ZTB1_PNEC8|nr:hypothetical protein T552_00256 [Pneumocystis carinii B80]KTW31618.1 hypothetical protein T552_00256 [Pneumocystis carinii B80]
MDSDFLELESNKRKKLSKHSLYHNYAENQIDFFKKSKQFSESLDDSSLDDSFSYTKRLRSTSIDNRSKIPSVYQQTSLKTPNSNRADTSSATILTIYLKEIDPLAHLDEILSLFENTIPQMTHESLLKLESILFHLQHTIWKI